MRRREFIAGVGAAAVVTPLMSRAQQSAMSVIGFLNTGSPDLLLHHWSVFRQALSETGFAEGRNAVIEYRWARGRYDHLPTLAAELVQGDARVIVANGPAVPVAKLATNTIPIVFVTGVDPVRTGLVASLNNPGGNLTGVTTLDVQLGPKLLEVLHQVVPNTARMAVLINPTNPAGVIQATDLRSAASKLGIALDILNAASEQEIDAAFARLAELQIDALLISSDAFFNSQCERFAELGSRYKVKAISLYREFPAAGGLMSYGTSIADLYRQAALYTGRILKGERPADLAVQQATKVELIVNLRTARALGVTVPISLLGRADQVIE